MTINDTPCKNCCFAIYDGITQIGCARDRIEKYRNHGSEVIEAYDNDREFYVIKNRLCPFYRDQKWLDAFDGKSDYDMEKILAFETMSSFHLIILLKEGTIEDLKVTLDSISFEFTDIPPAQITMVRPRGSSINPKEIQDLFKKYSVKWRVENLLVDKDDESIIHSAQKLIKTQYYCVCNVGYEFPKKYFKMVHNTVIDHLIQFGMIQVEEDQFDGTIIPLHVHEYWYFHGNAEDTIRENIKEYQCQNPEEKVIFQLKEIKNIILQSA